DRAPSLFPSQRQRDLHGRLRGERQLQLRGPVGDRVADRLRQAHHDRPPRVQEAIMVRAALGLILSLAGLAAQAANYSDLWWNPSESGWGLTIADHDTTL